MQSRVSFYLNEIFKYIVVFLILFVWINFYFPNFLASVVASAIGAAIICYFLTTLLYKKKAQQKVKSAEKKQIQNISANLVFSDLSENLKLLSKALDAKSVPHKLSEFGIILYPNTKNQIYLFPNFSLADIDESVIVSFYKLMQNKNILRALIAVNSVDSKVIAFANSIIGVNFVFWNTDQVYFNLLKPTNIFPEYKVAFKKQKNVGLKVFFTLLINKNNTRHYFFAGLITLFASYFIRFSTYYVLFSTGLFVLSLLSFYGNPIEKILQKRPVNVFQKNNIPIQRGKHTRPLH